MTYKPEKNSSIHMVHYFSKSTTLALFNEVVKYIKLGKNTNSIKGVLSPILSWINPDCLVL